MLGHDGFTVTPRRGELIVFDKLARPLVQHIVLAVPTKVTKGVLIAPTVFGNVMLGPTAEDVERKDDTESTRAGPRLPDGGGRADHARAARHEVTAVYAGLRAATEHADYQLTVHAPEGYACVGGIRSTGPVGLDGDRGARARGAGRGGAARSSRSPVRPPEFRMPNIGERRRARPTSGAELIERDADYGRIVCFCERVTRGELRDALDGPLPAVDLDGLRRRTRAHMGRCQGFFCGAELAALARRGGARDDGRASSAAAPPDSPRRSSCGASATHDVLVVEREADAGGIPRHAQHQGFGLRDLRRPLSGPAYARRYARLVARGRRRDPHRDDGHRLVARRSARADRPARPRAARHPTPSSSPRAAASGRAPRGSCPGSRPEGVMTTGTLQQLVYLKRRPVGERALVVGAEHVSFSALAHARATAGASAVGMTTELPRHQSLAAVPRRRRAALAHPALDAHRRDARSTAGRASRRWSSPTSTAARRARVACDTVVFTADWIPDHELAVMGGLAMDPGTRGPARGRRAPHLARRRVRRRQPSPRRRDGRRGRAERPPRRRRQRRASVRGSAWPEGARPDRVRAAAPLDQPQRGRAAARTRRRAAASRSARREFVTAAAGGGRPGRPHALGRPARRGSCPGAPRRLPPTLDGARSTRRAARCACALAARG